MANLQQLPIDISLVILSKLSFSDILSVRKTCRSFYELTHLRSVWHVFLINQIQGQNIPVPKISHLSLDSLDAGELERVAYDALCLRQNWTNSEPIARRTRILSYGTPSTQIGIISLQFVPGNTRFLVSVIYTNQAPQTRLFTIQCWDLAAEPHPKCVATRTIQHRARLALDLSSSNSISLAVQPQNCVELLTVDLEGGYSGTSFITQKEIPNRPDLLLSVYGSTIFSTDEQHRLFFWLIDDPDSRTELQTAPGQARSILELVHLDQVVIVFRRDRIDIFSIPDLTLTGGSPIPPIASHTWQWKLDSVSVAVCRGTLAGPRGRYPPINVLLRFGSILPWPVNILHCFSLCPDYAFDHSRPAGPDNVPYEFPPRLRRTIGSPVNLFSSYHMTIGPRGMALWIDSHSEDGQNEHGQRLAGSLIAEDPLPSVSNSTERGSEPTLEDSVESTFGSNVFRYNDHDDWARIAMDEEEGRVVIGRKDGSILLLDYA